jgi:hypothetical protein
LIIFDLIFYLTIKQYKIWVKISFIFLSILIILQLGCQVDEPEPECSETDLQIELSFNSINSTPYPKRRTSNLCLNIPVSNSNPCTATNVNEAAGINPLSVAISPPAPSEYWCNIRIDADCLGYPKRYGWLTSDVNIDCLKTILIPEISSTITVTFTESCQSCNTNSNGGCEYSREIFRYVTGLGGWENYLFIDFVYDQSDCSTYSNCN